MANQHPHVSSSAASESNGVRRESGASSPESLSPQEPSRGWVFALGLVSPGVAWALRGFVGRGVFVNLSLTLLWFAFAMYWVVEKFYPVEPLLWFGLCWAVFVGLSAWDASQTARRPTVPVTWYFLALMLVCTWIVPLTSVYVFARENIAEVVRVRTPTMFPTMMPGDTMVIDRHIYRISRPRPGDIIYYQRPSDDAPRLARVLAVEGEIVSVVQRAIYVSGMGIVQSELDDTYQHAFSSLTGADPADVGARFEANGSAVYWIAEPRLDHPTPPEGGDWFVREREVFVLNDNRSMMNDSRADGALSLDDIIGMPIYLIGNRGEVTSLRGERHAAVLQAPRTRSFLVEEQRRYMELLEHRK